MAPSSVIASFTSPTELLSSFIFERVLSEDARSIVYVVLGTAVPQTTGVRCPAILKFEKTPCDPKDLPVLASVGAWEKLEMGTTNDSYSTILGWLNAGHRTTADMQVSSICPATEKHIKKYSRQASRLIRETPELYRTVVKPYIVSLPANQITWVYNILDGLSESENVVYRDEDPNTGFVLTPDLKWDKTTLSALYLLVLTQSRIIRSLRDLRPSHLPLLRKIREESEKTAIKEYGLEAGQLRMFVHYQPSYYHFHVHVTHINYEGFPGITVGQAHLLDDIIDHLELESRLAVPPTTSYYEARTLTYALGTEHALYKGLAGVVAE